nr:MAG TPA: hypothetical protein [Caudoviricetes sp.]
MQEYIDELHQEMHKVMGKPVTLGRAEEVTVYADAICLLHKLSGDHFRESTKMMEFTEDDAKAWMDNMQNADGTTGPHWTMEQTTAVAESMGIQTSVVPRWAWGVTMNMMYSDYYAVAAEFGVDRPEFYAALAQAFLMDKDAPAPEEKLCEYYKHIASHS